MQKTLLLLVVFAGVATAIVPKSAGLRFKATANAPASEEAGIIKIGDTKPLSTAMKCVMSLVFMYMIVQIIQKAIIFKKDFARLWANIKKDTGMPDFPGEAWAKQQTAKASALATGKGAAPTTAVAEVDDEAKKEAVPAPADVVTEPAAAAAPGSTADQTKEALLKRAEQTKALGQATVGWVTDILSAEKMEALLTSMQLVPMFCILITFCRLRARVDLETEPQTMAKTWMQLATGGLFFTILMVIMPQFPAKEGESKKSAMCKKAWFYVVKVSELAALVLTYAGVGVIIHQIFTLKYKEDEYNKLKAPVLPGAAAAGGVIAPADATAPAGTF